MRRRLQRIGELARENKGHQMRPAFLGSLTQALNSPVDVGALQSLRLTDELASVAKRSYLASRQGKGLSMRQAFRANERDLALSAAKAMADELQGEPASLLTKQSQFCRAVSLEAADQALKRCEELLELDGDTVLLVSRDRQDGFMLDYNADDPIETYEVAVWGDRWSVAAFMHGKPLRS
jgi:hypothetical protein